VQEAGLDGDSCLSGFARQWHCWRDHKPAGQRDARLFVNDLLALTDAQTGPGKVVVSTDRMPTGGRCSA
jgi:hypothetical protein